MRSSKSATRTGRASRTTSEDAVKLEPPAATDPKSVLRALRAAIHGAGPAVALGGAGVEAVAPGTALVVTTSGSTGIPKSVVLSRSALTASALATAERIGEGRWLLALPAHYIAGAQVLIRSIISGQEPAVLSGTFSAAAFTAAARSLASFRRGARVPTYTSLVPAQLATLMDAASGAGGRDTLEALRSFEALLVGGQALPAALRERAAEAGVRVVRTYGSSETAGGCVYDGVALRGVGIRVSDRGDVLISGPTLADGYLGEPERTAASFFVDPDGTRWYRTGDEGSLARGVLDVYGRIDNVIVSGGINVSLDRLERCVQVIPGLAAAFVVGSPDERWGEVPVMVIAASDAIAAGSDALLGAARARAHQEIGVAARPARIVTVETIPLLPSGKPNRARLRALAARTPRADS